MVQEAQELAGATGAARLLLCNGNNTLVEVGAERVLLTPQSYGVKAAAATGKVGYREWGKVMVVWQTGDDYPFCIAQQQ